MTDIRTILFDMGNVLVHFSHERMCAQMGALCGRRGEEVRELLFDSGLQDQFESGQISEGDFHQAFETAVGQSLEFEELKEAGSDIFELNTRILPIIDALKSSGRRLVLLSNTSVSHFDFVREKFDVLQRFDAFVTSYGVGAVKPEPAIYEAALETIECDPSECFYTDDISEYIETARGYGLNAEVFVNVETLKHHLQVLGIAMKSGSITVT